MSLKDFLQSDFSEALVAGTIMSIQEKKSIKGTPFAIVKFSDNTGEFELFIFSEILINNRDKLKESNSFVLTLQKDKSSRENNLRRIGVKKILDLNDMINKSYKNVLIELNQNCDFEELKEVLKEEGSTEIKIIIRDRNKNLTFKLEKPRKFNFSTFNNVKSKQYVKKISF